MSDLIPGTVFRNGQVFGGHRRRVGECVAVRGGRVVAAGSAAEVAAHVGREAE